MLNLQNLFLLAITLLFSSHLFCNNKKSMEWNFYDKNPSLFQNLNPKQSLQPYKKINLEINELKLGTITDNYVSFLDIKNANEIIILKKDFLVENHTYNFEKSLIDGKKSFGHDGFYTKNYIKINFHSELAKICIVNDKLQTYFNITKKDFLVFIHPHLKSSNGDFSVKAYKVKKYFQYLIVLTGGGGAGSYESYILIDLYNKAWIYTKDIVDNDIVSFIPISKQKDPFSKNGEKIWYNIIFSSSVK